MNVIARNLKNVAVPAALVGLGLVTGVKANAQVIFNYTSSTVFDSTGTNTITVGGTTLRVDPAFDNNDNAVNPGTDIKLGAFVVNSSGAASDTFSAVPYTTTLTVSPQGIFAGDTVTYIIDGTLDTTVNSTQVNNTFVGISNLPQTKTFTMGSSVLDLTTSGFPGINLGGMVLSNQPHFDGINPPGGTAAGGFTIHISGGVGQTTTPEPGTVALLVSAGVSGSAFVLRKRRRA
jgi:hypothetical protein